MDSYIDYSVVIEWDNARFSERDRAVKMLRALGQQAGELSSFRPPVKVTFDPHEVDDGMIPACLEEAGALIDNLDIELLPVEGLSYYSQKNFGFSHTDTGFVIFLDSDVIPQANWLRNLLGTFENPAVEMVCGETFMTYSTMYERAFALFWFFNLKDKQPSLIQRHYFFANNVAFRRATFERHKFPELVSFRGQCLALARNLQKDGIAIYCNTAASVEHPPPVDGELFAWRALSAGYDETILNHALERPFYERGVLGAGKRFVTHIGRSAITTVKRHRDVGLTPATAVPAFGIAGGYYALKLVGELVSLVNPEPIRKHTKL